MTNTLYLFKLVLALLTLQFVFRLFLESLQQSRLKSAKSPEDAKAVSYHRESGRFKMLSISFDFALLLGMLLLGFLPWSLSLWSSYFGASLYAQIAYLLFLSTLSTLVGLPLDYVHHFYLEAKFGFNKMSVGLWLSDLVKGIVLSWALGYPILLGVLAFVHLTSWWWLIGFVIFAVFQLVMLLVYPRWILPWFNKLSPMPEGELKETLFKLAEKLSFPVKELLLMDGSKRSSRANAFFTGFGKFRRIVLFDTLTTELTTEETTAVLAHEIGHDKKGHIPRQMIFSFATMLVAFALAAWSAKQAFLFSAFGFSESLATSPSGAAIAFLLLGIIASPIMFWFSPLMNGFSRKYEYEADHFAKIAMGSAAPLVSSLKKLSKSNLPHPNPHPLVAAFYYSHPTVVEREKAMLKD